MAKIGAKFVLYEFRHTLATRFGEIVGDPIMLATILGHSRLRTMMKYYRPQATHTVKAVEKFIGARAQVELTKAEAVN